MNTKFSKHVDRITLCWKIPFSLTRKTIRDSSFMWFVYSADAIRWICLQNVSHKSFQSQICAGFFPAQSRWYTISALQVMLPSHIVYGQLTQSRPCGCIHQPPFSLNLLKLRPPRKYGAKVVCHRKIIFSVWTIFGGHAELLFNWEEPAWNEFPPDKCKKEHGIQMLISVFRSRFLALPNESNIVLNEYGLGLPHRKMNLFRFAERYSIQEIRADPPTSYSSLPMAELNHWNEWKIIDNFIHNSRRLCFRLACGSNPSVAIAIELTNSIDH